MEEQKYIDFDEIEERIDQEIHEHNQKIREREEKIAEKEHQEMSHLMDSMADQLMNDKTEKHDREMKEEKAKAIKAIDDKYDKDELIKSEDEKERDQAYQNLLGSLHINDDKSDTPDTLNSLGVDKGTYNKGLGIDDTDSDEKKMSDLDKGYLKIIKNYESQDDSDTSLSQYFK